MIEQVSEKRIRKATVKQWGVVGIATASFLLLLVNLQDTNSSKVNPTELQKLNVMYSHLVDEKAKAQYVSAISKSLEDGDISREDYEEITSLYKVFTRGNDWTGKALKLFEQEQVEVAKALLIQNLKISASN